MHLGKSGTASRKRMPMDNRRCFARMCVPAAVCFSSAMHEWWASVLKPLKLFQAHLSMSFPIMAEGSQHRHRVHCLVFNPFRIAQRSRIFYR